MRALLRSALWLVLVAVLAGRVAAMPGWMPVASAQGIEMALCNGGTMTMPMPMPMPGKQGMPNRHQANECPYAAAAHAGGMAETPQLPVALPLRASPTPPASLHSIVAGRALSLPPATGPPLPV